MSSHLSSTKSSMFQGYLGWGKNVFFSTKRMWTTDSHYVVGAQPLGNKASYMIKLILVSEILCLSGLIIKYKYTLSQLPKHVQLRGFSIDHKSLKIAQIKKIKTLCVSKSIIFFLNIFSKIKSATFFSPKYLFWSNEQYLSLTSDVRCFF